MKMQLSKNKTLWSLKFYRKKKLPCFPCYSYSSDCEIEVKVKGITAGIKDLQVSVFY